MSGTSDESLEQQLAVQHDDQHNDEQHHEHEQEHEQQHEDDQHERLDAETDGDADASAAAPQHDASAHSVIPASDASTMASDDTNHDEGHDAHDDHDDSVLEATIATVTVSTNTNAPPPHSPSHASTSVYGDVHDADDASDVIQAATVLVTTSPTNSTSAVSTSAATAATTVTTSTLIPIEVFVRPNGIQHVESFASHLTMNDVRAKLIARLDTLNLPVASASLHFEGEPIDGDLSISAYPTFVAERLGENGQVLDHDRPIPLYLDIVLSAGGSNNNAHVSVSTITTASAAAGDSNTSGASASAHAAHEDRYASKAYDHYGEEKQSSHPPVKPAGRVDVIQVLVRHDDATHPYPSNAGAAAGGSDFAEHDDHVDVVNVQLVREFERYKKPFLGGYRHKLKGTIMHHATTQTVRQKKKADVLKFERETQTISVISRSMQTPTDRGTQMERRDLLLSDQDTRTLAAFVHPSNSVVQAMTAHSQEHVRSRATTSSSSLDGVSPALTSVLVARPYFTADQLGHVREQTAIELQCFMRLCFAWRRVRRLREQREEKVNKETREKEAQHMRMEMDHQRQIERRMHPRSKQDFEVLYRELEAWRQHETERIKNDKSLMPSQIEAALADLLNKEVKLLQTIDRLKMVAAKENKEDRVRTRLEQMSSPKEWRSKVGDIVEVETPFTIRARELVDLYNALQLPVPPLPLTERLDVLLHVKYTVQEHPCTLTSDIIELIEREEELVRRGRSAESMTGLRKRIASLFLQFMQTPQFNPASGVYNLAVVQAMTTVVE